MKKQFIIATLLVVLIIILVGCSGNETKDNSAVIKEAASSFNLIVRNNVENLVYHNQLSHFGLLLKDNDKFEWTEDTSVSDADFSISINADEFIKAGLDVSKLKGTTFTYKKASENAPNVLIYKYNVSNSKVIYKDSNEAFEKLINQIPGQISTLKNDGYILSLNQGFQVHWNSDERVNKDMALIIGADDLIKAGLNVDKLNEWKVMKNKDSKNTQVRLLKIYYLK